jgi:hypothetical protein
MPCFLLQSLSPNRTARPCSASPKSEFEESPAVVRSRGRQLNRYMFCVQVPPVRVRQRQWSQVHQIRGAVWRLQGKPGSNTSFPVLAAIGLASWHARHIDSPLALACAGQDSHRVCAELHWRIVLQRVSAPLTRFAVADAERHPVDLSQFFSRPNGDRIANEMQLIDFLDGILEGRIPVGCDAQ